MNIKYAISYAWHSYYTQLASRLNNVDKFAIQCDEFAILNKVHKLERNLQKCTLYNLLITLISNAEIHFSYVIGTSSLILISFVTCNMS